MARALGRDEGLTVQGHGRSKPARLDAAVPRRLAEELEGEGRREEVACAPSGGRAGRAQVRLRSI